MSLLTGIDLKHELIGKPQHPAVTPVLYKLFTSLVLVNFMLQLKKKESAHATSPGLRVGKQLPNY